jgi:hypothetical protein
MRAFRRSALVFSIAVAAALPALGQIGNTCPRCSPVQRQPYMAEFKTTHVQTLADGTTITRETKEISALDSQGRRLNTNSMMFPGPSGQAEVLRTNVHDPVENTEASWDTQNKTARVTKLPPEDQRHGCWVNDAGNYRVNYGPIHPTARPGIGSEVTVGAGAVPGSNFEIIRSGSASEQVVASSSIVASMPVAAPGVVASVPPQAGANPAMNKPVREDLGTDAIEGVEVRGTRITRTIPVGQIGNDRPIVSTDESWMAPSLGGIVLRSVSDSPQTGKQTREVVSLAVGDPDPTVFQPPEGYKVTVDVLHEVPCQQNQ